MSHPADVTDVAGLGPAARATLSLDLPHSRQHSWTAGRPAPKYRPPVDPQAPAQGPPPSSRLKHLPRTSPSLALSPLQEDRVHAHEAKFPPHAMQQNGQLPGDLPPYGFMAMTNGISSKVQSVEMQDRESAALQQPSAAAGSAQHQHGQQFSSVPLLSMPAANGMPNWHSQDDSHQSQRLDWGSAQNSAANGSSQAAAAQTGSSARPLSPFGAEAEIPFTQHQLPKPVLTSCIPDQPSRAQPHSAGVHFEQNTSSGVVDPTESLMSR